MAQTAPISWRSSRGPAFDSSSRTVLCFSLLAFVEVLKSPGALVSAEAVIGRLTEWRLNGMAGCLERRLPSKIKCLVVVNRFCGTQRNADVCQVANGRRQPTVRGAGLRVIFAKELPTAVRPIPRGRRSGTNKNWRRGDED